jgi:hypothetical protein
LLQGSQLVPETEARSADYCTHSGLVRLLLPRHSRPEWNQLYRPAATVVGAAAAIEPSRRDDNQRPAGELVTHYANPSNRPAALHIAPTMGDRRRASSRARPFLRPVVDFQTMLVHDAPCSTFELALETTETTFERSWIQDRAQATIFRTWLMRSPLFPHDTIGRIGSI